MIVRCAYFEGAPAPEHKESFDRFFAEEAPVILKKFPGIISLRIMKAQSVEDNGHQIYLSVESVYPSLEAMKHALTQPAREEFKARMMSIMPMFKGRMFHITQELVAEK